MTDFLVAYSHPHRRNVACLEILCDPQPGWQKREPYRRRDVAAVVLRAGEAQAIALAEIRAMHEAHPDKTLQQLVDGWRWDRELYWRQR